MANEDGGIIEWSDPPPPRDHTSGPRRNWGLVAYQLRSNPGRWALVDNIYNTSVAARISMGKVHWWAPRGSFEAVLRVADDGRPGIWARYVGDPNISSKTRSTRGSTGRG